MVRAVILSVHWLTRHRLQPNGLDKPAIATEVNGRRPYALRDAAVQLRTEHHPCEPFVPSSEERTVLLVHELGGRCQFLRQDPVLFGLGPPTYKLIDDR